MARKYNSGKFKPKNIQKYKGDVSKIEWRSQWERQFMAWLDRTDNVTRWSSEEIVIQYTSRADKGKKRRYFVDFWVKFADNKEYLIEVKPLKETRQPKPPKNITKSSKKSFDNALYTFQVNVDKWKAAIDFATSHNMKFEVLTEVSLRKLGLNIY